jgi:PTS system galactitol-specific IIC component
MSAIASVIDFIRGMGAAAMMPIFIIIIGLIVKVPWGKLFRAALTVGVGFIGMFLVMDLLGAQLGPASQALVQRFGLDLDVLDVGWPVSASFAWSSPTVPLIFVAVLATNIVMILAGLTRTLDVDIWNYWGFNLAGAMVYYTTNSVALSVLAAVITAAVTFVLADKAAPITQHFMPGISFPHSCSIFWMPYAVFMDKIYDRIPGFNKLNADPEYLKEKIGFAGDPMVIGFALGIILGALAGFGVQQVIVLGINMAAVMLLLPKMVGLLMEGLSVIAAGTQEFARNSKLLKGKELYIGIDGGILMGRPSVICTGVIMIPIMLILAVIIPGNRVLPFADLAVLTSWFCWNAVASKDNVIRGVISSTIMGAITLIIATNLSEIHNIMAVNSGYTFPEGVKNTTSLCMGQELVPGLLYYISKFFK